MEHTDTHTCMYEHICAHTSIQDKKSQHLTFCYIFIRIKQKVEHQGNCKSHLLAALLFDDLALYFPPHF